ncbi:acetyl-CoA carboxylase2 [Zea mays]|uniref:Acetyl-CoA carboxylase2 n=1 Tax=Zea mays TaxID=4577 RepID=A0A1D6EDQ3_MAIZE|nr:acetyl-CoA carboxylase2 [Zea mays]
MSQLGLAAAASKALPLLPNRQRSSAGTTFSSSSLSRPLNRRKSRTRSLRDGGDGVSDAKKHSQSVRQGLAGIIDLPSEAPSEVDISHGSEDPRGPTDSYQMNGIINETHNGRHASVSKVVEFCAALGGKTPIHSILVANNGMAAAKFMRSVRTWANDTFGSEKAIQLIAMATPEDMRINAEHIRIADQFVEVPGGTNNNNYANVQLIVEMAQKLGVSAVWPGWGHASENPELPDVLTAKGIVFLGPPASSMNALGDKVGSALIAQAAGVPTLAWSGSHVEVPLECCLDAIPEEMYRKACVTTTEEAVASCQVVGYPAMIKASWGGGGKGIRKVHNDDEVRALFKQVQGEVPGSPIFVMRLASQSRHLEVQLLCDQYGNVAALHSRDCSVQRRHQKIIEEGPVTVAPRETVKALEQAARRLAKAVGYVGAATVEYLYSMETEESLSFTSNSILRSLMTAIEELELHAIRTGHSHMYLCILKEQKLLDLIPFSGSTIVDVGQDEATACSLLKSMALKIHELVGARMHHLSVCQWEVKLKLDCDGPASGTWRVVTTNVTGHTCTIDIYREVEEIESQKLVYHSATSSAGPLHGVALNNPYQPLSVIDLKRCSARNNRTTYCYDFPLAFETALQKSWQSNGSTVSEGNENSKSYVKATELVFAEKHGSWGTPIIPMERPAGLNDIGMVAWIMEMSTPEFPNGRQIIVVANDITFRAGSFGPREDAFFETVTNLACERKLPLIYLAANSGARIGIADEVKSCFRVGWSDEGSPERGFQYIYLTEEDYARISSSVIAHKLELDSGEIRWIIDSVVGKEDGLGVENIHGSAAIASAYSRAYEETFTLTFVTGRTVGIGAYLARLGIRCIQRLDQPIILTGFSALNKLLGREVYSSHMQLGGPKIMATNGVVHLTVPDDLEGVSNILRWLSYVPANIGGPLPITKPLDPPDRPVAYIPENTCDPRAAICGVDDSQGKWLGGMFDKDSFVETFEGWAKTVVTGRAKLGGIPVGVIAVETQTMMQIIPADPGQLDSHERSVPRAGQVWFPDSATKTAQALLDFNREGLPLFILANWRGFSGGQRDLFEGILQAGSTIVENLRTYNQPAFVYIPMAGELRGGAWVVVDSKINPDRIECYAERTAKGNVLEPQGLIEIKFRSEELQDCMGRLDPELINLKAKLQDVNHGNGSLPDIEGIRKSIEARTKQLLPLYTQIAIRFAELHDTSLRMAAKGVIKKVVDWEESRSFFYKRLRRRIAEDVLAKEIRQIVGDKFTHQLAMELIKEWYLASQATTGSTGWDDDDAFVAWKDSPENYKGHIQKLRAQKVSHSLSDLADSSSDLQAFSQGLSTLLDKMDPSQRAKFVQEVKKVLD